jgi:hypothetical protein
LSGAKMIGWSFGIRCRAVDVADDEMPGVFVDEPAELIGRAAVGERAAGR